MLGELDQFAGAFSQPGFNGFFPPGGKMIGFVPGQGEIEHPAQLVPLPGRAEFSHDVFKGDVVS